MGFREGLAAAAIVVARVKQRRRRGEYGVGVATGDQSAQQAFPAFVNSPSWPWK
jgi:hypothetical protein